MTEITLNHITKIEGHAHLHVAVEKGIVTKCELGSIEGSRYFEGLLKGRNYDEASEISSRICGICSCAHTIAAIMAVENSLGVEVSNQTLELRKLLTLAERIRSHATHLYFLALPDYLGYESALAMIPKYKKEIQLALQMMKVGNEMVKIIGGRDLHPVSCTVGGFLKLPETAQLRELAKELEALIPLAEKTITLFSSLKYPDISCPTQYMSLTDDKEFAMLTGKINVDGKLAGGKTHYFEQTEFHKFIAEYHEQYSSANFVVKDGKRYMVGAIARMNNNWHMLMPKAKSRFSKFVKNKKLKMPLANPYLNNFCQAVELLHSIEHSIKICKTLDMDNSELKLAEIKMPVSESLGIAGIEVPRGVLWHEYKIGPDGKITYANIVTPTAQNLRNMQDDIKDSLPGFLKTGKSKEEINLDVEKLIRAYDPCFSCSTHFLEVEWEEK